MRRPYVLINVAATVDGKIDTLERRGAAISSDRDRERVDALRASVDAVMVGGRTLLDEDPRLTLRSPKLRGERVARGEPEHPAKVGVVSRLALQPDCRFLTAGPSRVMLFIPCGRPQEEVKPLRDRGIEIYEAGESRVDLVSALANLAELGMRRLLVEGGGTLNFELLRLGLVDEVQVFIAPLIFGGATSPTLADGGGLARDLAVQLRRTQADAWEDGGVLLRYIVERT